jgi:hypothetical protein
MTLTHRFFLVLLTAVLFSSSPGCGRRGAGAADGGAGNATGDSLPTTRPVTINDTGWPSAMMSAVQLDIYQMTVPAGAVSRSDEFWKRVEENRVDPATYDLLLKNGVRIGVAHTSEWDYFRDILEQNNASSMHGTATSGRAGSIQLIMKKNVKWQDIGYLTDRNEVVGRSYEECNNLFGVSFWPEPRRPNEMRVEMTPLVRARRTRLRFRLNNEEQELVNVADEYLYDLNLRAIIPASSFLIIAPSSEVERSTSLGAAFLRSEGDTVPKEQVLVLVPKSLGQLRPR